MPISGESVESIQAAEHRKGLQEACLCAAIAEDFRGSETLVLDLTGVTPIVDYFVITTGNSRRQMHAIADETDRVLASRGSHRMGLEGYDSSSWILHDYGDIVLHVFTAEARGVYDLENLWADAPRVDWRAVNEKAASGP